MVIILAFHAGVRSSIPLGLTFAIFFAALDVMVLCAEGGGWVWAMEVGWMSVCTEVMGRRRRRIKNDCG